MTEDGTEAFGTADLAATFRLGAAQIESLRDALAPAFALGLQQALASPARWPELSRLFFAGVRPPRDPQAGGDLLDLFFGASGLRDAVSRQAAGLTGLAPDLVAEMMPRLAVLGTQAMMRGAMANVLPRAAPAFPADDLGRLTAEMMRRGANAVEALSTPAATAPRAAPSPLSPFFVFDAFGDAVRATLGAPARPAAPAGGAFEPPAPFAPLFEAFAKGMRSAVAATGREDASGPPAGSPPDAAAPARPDPGLMEVFVQSGRHLQDGYVREMAGLFARFSTKDRDGGT